MTVTNEYVFTIKLTTEEFNKLRQAGDILSDAPKFTVNVGVEPIDLIPEPLQKEVQMYIQNCLAVMCKIKRSYKVSN